MGKHRKRYGRLQSASINHIKTSSRSNKHVKRGKKGKDCIYFNHDKLTCNYYKSLYYKIFCKSSDCDYYMEETKINNKPAKKKNDVLTNKKTNNDLNINSGLSDYDKTYIKNTIIEIKRDINKAFGKGTVR